MCVMITCYIRYMNSFNAEMHWKILVVNQKDFHFLSFRVHGKDRISTAIGVYY